MSWMCLITVVVAAALALVAGGYLHYRYGTTVKWIIDQAEIIGRGAGKH